MSRKSESKFALQRLFADNVHPDIEMIRTYVREGADVTAPLSQMQGHSVLEFLLRSGAAEEVEVFLDNAVSIKEERLFKAICFNENASEIVHIVLSSISLHFEDFVNYNVLFSVFGSLGLFSLLCKGFGKLSFSNDLFIGVRVDGMFEFDRDFASKSLLKPGIRFRIQKLWNESTSTASLVRELADGSPDPLRIQQCIENGANLGFEHPYLKGTLLSFILGKTSIECVKAALHVTKPIDFTVAEKENRSPLLALCLLPDTKKAAERLRLIVERVEENPEDLVDFTQRTKSGKDILSLAAEYKRLSVFWPVICRLPFFDDNITPFLLTGKVYLSDWSLLSTKDQKRFEVQTTIICDVEDKATS